MNLQPLIIGPSAGDLEQARIKRLLDLAQLEQLRRAPVIEQQKLDLQNRGLLQAWEQMRGQQALAERQLAETSKYHTTTTGIDRDRLKEAMRATNLQDENVDLERAVTQRGQDITQRGQDMSFNATVRGQDRNLDQTLINALQMNPNLMAEVLNKRGVPEVLGGMKAVEEQQKVKQLSKLSLDMKSLDDKGKAAMLGTIADPDVAAALQQMYPNLKPISKKKGGNLDDWSVVDILTPYLRPAMSLFR